MKHGDNYDGPLEEGMFIPGMECPSCECRAERLLNGTIFQDHDDECPIATGVSKEKWALRHWCSEDPWRAADEIERLRGLMKCQACGCQSFECDQCAESVDLSGEPGGE